MEPRRGKLFVAGIITMAVATAGCGGSGVDRAKLLTEVSSRLPAGGIPADLGACVTKQAKGLPTSQLQAFASAAKGGLRTSLQQSLAGSSSANASPATQQLSRRLFNECVAQGKGADALHRQLSEAFSGPSTLPPRSEQCLVANANAVRPVTLADLESDAFLGHLSQTTLQQLGTQLVGSCVGIPGFTGALQAELVDAIKPRLAGAYSTAFTNCVIGKYRSASASQTALLIISPSTATAFGAQASQSCVAQGVQP